MDRYLRIYNDSQILSIPQIIFTCEFRKMWYTDKVKYRKPRRADCEEYMFIVLGGGLLVIIIAVIVAVVSSVVSAVAADQDIED